MAGDIIVLVVFVGVVVGLSRLLTLFTQVLAKIKDRKDRLPFSKAEIPWHIAMIALVPAIGFSVWYIIHGYMKDPRELSFPVYLLTMTPLGDVADFIEDIQDFSRASVPVLQVAAIFTFRAAVAGLGAFIIRMFSRSLFKNLKDDSKWPAMILAYIGGFLYTLLISHTVCGLLDLLMDYDKIDGVMTAPGAGLPKILVILLFIVFLVVFGLEWFVEVSLYALRIVFGGLFIDFVLNEIVKADLSHISEIWVMIVIVYWIIRQMEIEKLETFIEDLPDTTRFLAAWLY